MPIEIYIDIGRESNTSYVPYRHSRVIITLPLLVCFSRGCHFVYQIKLNLIHFAIHFARLRLQTISRQITHSLLRTTAVPVATVSVATVSVA
jgi:hypothetical protein